MPDDLTIEAIEARAEMVVTSYEVTPGQGRDEACTVIAIRSEGPMTSNDPRMEGVFKANAKILVNDRGEGASRDDWEVVDAETGRVKATGTAHAIHADPNPVRAVSIGRLEDGSRFFAHGLITLPSPGSDDPIVIEYGGPGLTDSNHRAVAVSGGELLDPVDPG